MSALWESPFFGVTLTILAYWAGCKIQKRTGLVICNGLVLAVMMIIAVLAVFDIPYAAYNAGGSLINLFLGPATVCLAVTIYAQIDLLKKNLLPILAGCAAGAVTSVLSIWGLCRLFGLDRTLTVSLLPKSVTTPIATILPSERIGEQYTRITAYWGVLPVTLGIPTEISRSRVVSHLKSAGTADEGSCGSPLPVPMFFWHEKAKNVVAIAATA